MRVLKNGIALEKYRLCCWCHLTSYPSQLNNPALVEGLVLIDVDPCAEGWIDWAASKVRI